jgi:hypothetical protein
VEFQVLSFTMQKWYGPIIVIIFGLYAVIGKDRYMWSMDYGECYISRDLRLDRG